MAATYTLQIVLFYLAPFLFFFCYRFKMGKKVQIKLPSLSLRYLLVFYVAVTTLALYRGSDKWIGNDWPLYFGLITDMARYGNQIEYFFTVMPRMSSQPVPVLVIAALVKIGLPLHFIPILVPILGLIGAYALYKIIEESYGEKVAAWGLLIYTLTPSILFIEAVLFMDFFALIFGLLSIYSWVRRSKLTSLFLFLMMGSHLILSLLFTVSLAYLAFKERRLRELFIHYFFAVIILEAMLFSTYFFITEEVRASYPLYLHLLRPISSILYYPRFFAKNVVQITLTEFLQLSVTEILKIIGLIGTLAICYYHRHVIRKPEWDLWILVSAPFIVLGFLIVPQFWLPPYRWAIFVGTALLFLVPPNLRDEDMSILLIFQTASYVLLASTIGVYY